MPREVSLMGGGIIEGETVLTYTSVPERVTQSARNREDAMVDKVRLVGRGSIERDWASAISVRSLDTSSRLKDALVSRAGFTFEAGIIVGNNWSGGTVMFTTVTDRADTIFFVIGFDRSRIGTSSRERRKRDRGRSGLSGSRGFLLLILNRSIDTRRRMSSFGWSGRTTWGSG
jgi:hypothetical protein